MAAPNTFENLTELLRTCRTYRRFTQEPIAPEILRAAVDNARIASSAANMQPLRYTVVTDPDVVARMQPLVKWAAYLPPEIGTPGPGEQPTAFIAVAKVADANAFSDIDAGLAVQSLVATAWEAGVGSCIMASIDKAAIAQLLEIPEDHELRLVVAMGYPSHTSTIADVAEDGSIKYYVDDERNYFVTKRPLSEVARFI